MLRLGLDIGSTTAKGVLLDGDNRVREAQIMPTGTAPARTAQDLRESICRAAGCEPERICATGYGRALVGFATKRVTEITCHAAGVCFRHPQARTIIDIGGQDSKAILLAAGGGVADFAMNDKCAAGTGSFLDAIARKFSYDMQGLSELHRSNPVPLEISSTCVVFAESEVVGLLAAGHGIEEVLTGVHAAIARRVARLFAQVSGEAPLYFSGGVAQNATMRLALERELGLPVTVAQEPQLMGALGAALLA